MPDDSKPNSYSIDYTDIAEVVEFSPHEQSGQLLAIGTDVRVTVGSCRFESEDKDVDGVEFEHIRDFHHGSRVTSIAWSPETTLYTVPRIIRFCTAGGDKKLRVFTSNLKENDSVKIIEGHTDYINDVTFDPEKGEQIASVSDDLSCRIFDMDGTQHMRFPLLSPGMSVRWHRDDPMKLMVAEKSGIIRFYNLLTMQPIMSLDCGHTPLMSADWSLINVLKVVAVVENKSYLFDTSQSSRPLVNRQVHTRSTCEVRWSRTNENVYAATGENNSQLQICHYSQNQSTFLHNMVTSNVQVGAGLTWHHKLPIVAMGGDRKIYFWLIDRF